MNKEDICYMSACDVVEKIKIQEFTVQEITETIIERIEKINPILNAYCTPTFELAREMAKLSDLKIKNGVKLGILEGIPTSIKDLTPTKGIRTTFGSKLYEHYIPKYDDILVKRMKNAGAIILGKTNTPAFGFKGVTDNLIFGATKNPWDITRTPGGSSGGAGAAVASGLCALGQGSDGGGSIRIPSSYCGVYGIKPSFGRVPQPIMKFDGNKGTLSQKGPIVRYVRDAALMLDAIVGENDVDRYSLPKPNFRFLEKLNETPKKLKIGVSLDLGFVKAVDPEVRKSVLDSVQKFESLGWSVDKSDIEIKNAGLTWSIIWAGGISQTLSPFIEEFRNKNVIEPGLLNYADAITRSTAADILSAEIEREKIYLEVCRHFKNFDILICPTMATPPIRLDQQEKVDVIDGIDVSDDLGAWVPFTPTFNLTGNPAASIPCGWTKKDGLPIGMMIVGKRLDDLTVLQVSQAFEDLAPWQNKRPMIM